MKIKLQVKRLYRRWNILPGRGDQSRGSCSSTERTNGALRLVERTNGALRLVERTNGALRLVEGTNGASRLVERTTGAFQLVTSAGLDFYMFYHVTPKEVLRK